MLKLRISDLDLDKLEKYLQELLSRFQEDHGYSNTQITFSGDKWGFIDNGVFTEIGKLHDLDKWLRTAHCTKCSQKQDHRQYDIKYHARDEDGHLAHIEEWNEIWLNSVSKEEGILMLTQEHMQVIDFLRNYYEMHEVSPMIHVLSRKTGFSIKKIFDLFPNGPRSAVKIAGLPRPRSHD